ncbi:MAG: hypothetical protein U0704_14190 [Candidatus Eisenbacteria bacterium]
MKIVLGFDDSPHAQAALEWIRRQSWPAATRIVVVSAVRAPVTAYAEVYAPAVPYPTELVEELTRRTHAKRAGSREPALFSCTSTRGAAGPTSPT